MPALLEARGISKSFPGVRALDDVRMHLHPGEVLALVGENGAGKSTLMKILAGVYQPDAGELLQDGVAVRFPDVRAASAAGVCLIHQELNLAENLSVAANLFLGREKLLGGPLQLLDRAGMRREAGPWLQRVGLPESAADRAVHELAPGQKQLVEIARALAAKARVLIMDEPTSSLTQAETDRLYEVIDDLRNAGVAVVYISHRLAEVKRLADRATVLRDGKNAAELARDEISHESLVRAMVGRELKALYPRTRPASARQPVLSLQNITYRGGPSEPVSFDLFAGEVLGMAGLVGAGRTELAEAIFGLRAITAGRVFLNGEALRIRKPADAVRAGLGMVPEDRRQHGLLLPEGTGFNVSLPNLASLSKGGVVAPKRLAGLGRSWIERLRIRTPTLGKPVGQLSGGNQQKVVFAKWLARAPKLLILDEPTRGVDVGARGELYAIVDRLAAAGTAVWMITSDMEELLGMSDRIAMLHEGRLAGIVPRDAANEETLMRLATGGTP
jgi:ribose transport system ATP-binding protein